jgi:AAA+ superfamily predicted ATPase
MFEMQEDPLGPEDFDPDFDRSTRADKNRDDVFRGMVGFEEIVKQFRGYQKMADGMQLFGVDPKPHIPWAFVFKGPPGTGKTYVYFSALLMTSDYSTFVVFVANYLLERQLGR